MEESISVAGAASNVSRGRPRPERRAVADPHAPSSGAGRRVRCSIRRVRRSCGGGDDARLRDDLRAPPGHTMRDDEHAPDGAG
jgi:hypothetical protein